jgi:hypothetical protein
MNPQELQQCLVEKLVPIISTNNGLPFFARRRSKFEAWLKVELCSIFKDDHPEPEWEHFDIKLDDWIIELKTVNNSYVIHDQDVNNIIRPITDNINSIIKDIEKLQNRRDIRNYHRGVIFIAFPFDQSNLNHEPWQEHIARIQERLNLSPAIQFQFYNTQIYGQIYLGWLN